MNPGPVSYAVRRKSGCCKTCHPCPDALQRCPGYTVLLLPAGATATTFDCTVAAARPPFLEPMQPMTDEAIAARVRHAAAAAAAAAAGQQEGLRVLPVVGGNFAGG